MSENKRDECERVVATILRDFDPETGWSRTLAAEIVAAVFEELKKPRNRRRAAA